jgi:asparagine synthase (glutamine-hydrolysing)
VAYTGPKPTPGPDLCLLDGWIDNTLELAAELQLERLASSEEQLLLLGWHRWGAELLPRLRGEFALLLWSDEREEGLLARDQLGTRPLFVQSEASRLRFAGEIKHLLAMLPRRPMPDRASLAHWLTLSLRPGTATLFEGISRLPAGTILHLRSTGPREERYWRPRYVEPLSDEPGRLAETFRASLDLAVDRRLARQGRTCVLMSGGLDSSSVAAVAAALAPGAVDACSAAFPEHPAVDESELIELLRGTLGLSGITAEVRSGGLLASAIESIRAWDLPLRSWGDFWALPLLKAAAAGGAEVTLGGDGGDEVFGVRAYLLADQIRAGRPLSALRMAHELPGAGNAPPRRELAAMLAEIALAGALPHRLHRGLRSVAGRHGTPSWLRKRAAAAFRDSDDPDEWKRLDGPRWWARTAYELTAGVEGTGVFEHQRQRAALAGLHARHPMFDLDLLELALRQPPLATFDRHRNRPILRSAMASSLPDLVRLRASKARFDSLITESLDGADGISVRALLTDPAARLGEYVDLTVLDETFFGTAQGPPFRRMWQLWRLATAECWLRAQDNESSLEAIATSQARIRLRYATAVR